MIRRIAVLCLATIVRKEVRSLSMPRLLPSLPSRPLDTFGLALQDSLAADLDDVYRDQQLEEENRDQIFSLQKKIAVINNQLMDCVRSGDVAAFPTQSSECLQMINQLLGAIRHDPCQREYKVSHLIEKTLVPNILYKFYTEGFIPSLPDFGFCNDDEYVGALTGFAQELSRYVINRACENDVNSIELCRRVIIQLNEALLSLDFRNGPLRRKYDSVKYAVKAIEGIAFEFSLASDTTTVLFSDGALNIDGQLSKKARMDTEEVALESYIDLVGIREIQQRMEAYDQCREQIIKESRDVQKLSKQAIFALQRNNLSEAEKKLSQAKSAGLQLVKKIEAYPTLRAGALSNAIEEWTEAMLLCHWVSHKRFVSRKALELPNVGEYIGGLSDFTGEIGRIAVLRAAQRELPTVKEILQADMVVQNFISRANVSVNRYSKKLDAVQVNLKKVEDIVYELTLVMRSNRVSRVKADIQIPSEKADANEE